MKRLHVSLAVALVLRPLLMSAQLVVHCTALGPFSTLVSSQTKPHSKQIGGDCTSVCPQ